MRDTIAPQPEQPDDEANWQKRRQYKRKPVLWGAKLETATGRHECITLDLSLGGAKLRLAVPVAMHDTVTLVLERFGALAAEVAWVEGRTIGIRFTEDPQHVADILGRSLPL